MSDGPWIDPAIADYVAARTEPPDEVLRDLIEETAAATGDRKGMQVSPDEGVLLGLLTRMVGAERAVEVGTFTGYSSICIARALAPGGHLLCCDVSEEYTAIARRAWARAGVDDRITLRIGPAADTLRELPDDPPIDLAFIDADKRRYGRYYEELVRRLRPGGAVIVDNTLWSGRVARGGDDPDTKALQEFNDMVAADQRVVSYLLPIRDGVTLAVKR
jgi:caffeoyl-CoA O-methyltransferase